MPWYVYLMVSYFALQAAFHILYIGRSVEITTGGALITTIVSILMVVAILHLATH